MKFTIVIIFFFMNHQGFSNELKLLNSNDDIPISEIALKDAHKMFIDGFKLTHVSIKNMSLEQAIDLLNNEIEKQIIKSKVAPIGDFVISKNTRINKSKDLVYIDLKGNSIKLILEVICEQLYLTYKMTDDGVTIISHPAEK